MKEASKTKNFLGERFKLWFSGKGIDIGCGNDPITENCKRFDKADGDANKITNYVKEQFDFVCAFHCLEHMIDPKNAINEWFKLVRPGGFLIIAVPDEDLYEQGVFPSRYNRDHKWTFTIDKENSWSPKSVNVKDLISSLNGDVEALELQDKGYNYSIKDVDQTYYNGAMAQIFFVVRRKE